jgi:hypothetical protein
MRVPVLPRHVHLGHVELDLEDPGAVFLQSGSFTITARNKRKGGLGRRTELSSKIDEK